MAQYMDFNHNKYHTNIDIPDKECVLGLMNTKNKNQKILNMQFIQNPNFSMNFYEFLIRRKYPPKLAVIPH